MEITRLVVDDADTGNEIMFFYRRGKPYLYLRDAYTKRFIKRLREVEVRVYQVVEYSRELARKGNPLYLDAVGKTIVTVEEIKDLDRVEDRLEIAVYHIVMRYFGKYVAFDLLELRGTEYGSEKTTETYYEDEKFTWTLVWKHHPEDRPESEEGIGFL